MQQLTVRDMQDNNLALVQCQDDVKQYNSDFKEDYNYYYLGVKENKFWGCIYGSYSMNLTAKVDYVGIY